MGRWKYTNPYGVHGVFYKKLSKLYGRAALELEKILESGTLTEKLTARRTILMKDAKKGKVASN